MLTVDELEGLKRLRFENEKKLTHLLVIIYDMMPTLNLGFLGAFLEAGFDFTEQDAFGFTPLNYAIALVHLYNIGKRRGYFEDFRFLFLCSFKAKF